MNRIKATIITPVYNAADTIERTIKSVLSQTYSDIEYIIIDNFSNDGTEEIIDRYEKQVTRVIRETDTGVYEAMNKGIEAATGDIIGIINADDWYEPNAVERVVDAFSAHEADAVCGASTFYEQNGDLYGTVKPRVDDLPWITGVPHPSVFISADAYRRFGKYDTRYTIAADYDLLLRIYCEGGRFFEIQEVLADVTMGGISFKYIDKSFLEAFSISYKYLGFAKDRGKTEEKIFERYYSFLFDWTKNNRKGMINWGVRSMKGTRELVVFGAGKRGREWVNLLLSAGVEISAIVDNDPCLWGKDYRGIEIVSFASREKKDTCAIIAVKHFVSDIIEQIKGSGFEMRYVTEYEARHSIISLQETYDYLIENIL